MAAGALEGDEFELAKLPDARAMVIGIARALVRSGTDPDDIVDAIIEAMD